MAAPVGEVTSGAWGHRVGACIGMGMLRADLVEPGRRLEVEIFGAQYGAEVLVDAPVWDASNQRLRG